MWIMIKPKTFKGYKHKHIFSVYGRPLDVVTSFKYLGQLISAADDDWPEVVRNL